MRSRPLTEQELRRLLVPGALAGQAADVRGQLAVRLLAVVGLTAVQLRSAQLVDWRGTLLRVGDRRLALDEETQRLCGLVADADELPRLLIGTPRSASLAAAGLRQLVHRFGERRSVPAVSPQRLVCTHRVGLVRCGAGYGRLRQELGLSERRLREWARRARP